MKSSSKILGWLRHLCNIYPALPRGLWHALGSESEKIYEGLPSSHNLSVGHRGLSELHWLVECCLWVHSPHDRIKLLITLSHKGCFVSCFLFFVLFSAWPSQCALCKTTFEWKPYFNPALPENPKPQRASCNFSFFAYSWLLLLVERNFCTTYSWPFSSLRYFQTFAVNVLLTPDLCAWCITFS